MLTNFGFLQEHLFNYFKQVLIHVGLLSLMVIFLNYFEASSKRSIRSTAKHLYKYRWALLVIAIFLGSYRFITIELELNSRLFGLLHTLLFVIAFIAIERENIPPL